MQTGRPGMQPPADAEAGIWGPGGSPSGGLWFLCLPATPPRGFCCPAALRAPPALPPARQGGSPLSPLLPSSRIFRGHLLGSAGDVPISAGGNASGTSLAPRRTPSPSPKPLRGGGDGRKEQRGWPGSPSRPPSSFCFRRGCTGDA